MCIAVNSSWTQLGFLFWWGGERETVREKERQRDRGIEFVVAIEGETEVGGRK